jgi:hypothetical protein
MIFRREIGGGEMLSSIINNNMVSGIVSQFPENYAIIA